MLLKCESGPGNFPAAVHVETVPSALTFAETMSSHTFGSLKAAHDVHGVAVTIDPGCMRKLITDPAEFQAPSDPSEVDDCAVGLVGDGSAAASTGKHDHVGDDRARHAAGRAGESR